MNHQRAGLYRALCLIACFGCATLGCERTSVPENGLTSAQLNVSQAKLMRNSALEFVIALPEGAEALDYAVVSGLGESHLFEVVPSESARAIKVLPLGSLPAGWANDVVDGSSDVAFMTLEQLAKEPPALTAEVGVVQVGADGAGDVSWLGAAPSIDIAAVLYATDGGVSRKRIKGAGSIVDGKLSMKNAPGAGTYFVLSDGALMPGLGDYVVGLVGQDSSAKVDGFEFTRVEFDLESVQDNEQLLKQRALDLGVDALSWKDEDGFHIIGIDPLDERVGSGQGFVPGLLGVTVSVKDQSELFKVITSLDHVRRGHPLSAYVSTLGAKMSVAKSELVGALRSEELVGGAGRAQWMYAWRAQGKSELQAPEYIYLSRAYLLAGSPSDAGVMAVQALNGFNVWAGRGRQLGLGRAHKLVGIASRQKGNGERALKSFDSSVYHYKEAGDEISAAQVESLARDMAKLDGLKERALLEGKRSRSRYYHGNDIFSCGQIELEMAEVYLDYGMNADAESTANYGLLRMKELGSKAGVNRAQIVSAMVQHSLNPGSVKLSDVRAYYDQARATRDGWAEVNASSALALLGAEFDPEELEQLGQSLEHGYTQFGGLSAGVNVERALASVCAQGYGESSQSSGALCERLMKNYAPGDQLLARWTAQGYGNILRGMNQEINRSSARLSSVLNEQFQAKNPGMSAQIELYLSAAAELMGDADAKKRYQEQAFVHLRKLDDNQRASTMYELAMELEQRGQTRFKQPLLKEAMDAAHEQGQRSLSTKAGLEYIATLRHEGLLEEALSAVQRVQGRLGANSDQAAAQLAMERALLGKMRGTTSSAKADWGVAEDAVKKLDAVPALDVLMHTFEASLMHAKGAYSSELETQIKRVEAGMPSSLITTLDGKRVLAHAEFLKALQLETDGNLTSAVKLANSAAATLADDPDADAVWIRARALSLIARYTTSTAQTEETEQQLEELWRQQAGALRRGEFSSLDYRAPVAVARALVDIRALRGDAKGAQAVLSELIVSGLSPTTELASVACERGRLMVFSGDLKKGSAELDRCITLKPRGEVAYRAKMIRALLEEEPVARRSGITRLLDSRDARERARRKMLLDLSAPKVLGKAEERAEAKLRKSYASTQDGEPRLKAGTALVSMLLEYGKITDAREALDELKSLFYELGEEYPVDYVRLKTQLMHHELHSIDAQLYLDRASVELPQGLEPERQVMLDLTRAELALALGQWTKARALLGEAYELANENDLESLTSQINALAAVFELKL